MTGTERKLLNVLADPKSFAFKIKDIISRAGISKQSFYNAVKKPSFKREYVSLIKNSILANTPAVLKKVTKQAIEGRPEQQAMFLRMAGLISNKLNIDMNVLMDGEVNHNHTGLDFAGLFKAIKDIRDNPSQRAKPYIEIDQDVFNELPEAEKEKLKVLEYDTAEDQESPQTIDVSIEQGGGSGYEEQEEVNIQPGGNEDDNNS